MPQNNSSSKNTSRKVTESPQKISDTKEQTPKKVSNWVLFFGCVLFLIISVPYCISSASELSKEQAKYDDMVECDKKQDYKWNGSECVREEKSSSPSSDVYDKNTSSNSGSSSSSSSSNSFSKPTTKKAYGSDPNDPDTYTGVGESLEDKQIRAHILCKHYAEDYFYPSKVTFSSITGVVTDEEQYYGWRYDVMMDVKSASGGKRSYIMHCIAGGFNTKDYSDGKVTMFEALPR